MGKGVNKVHTKMYARVYADAAEEKRHWVMTVCKFKTSQHPNAVSLWAWARLQEPPLTWLDARGLAEAKAIHAFKAHWPNRARLHWMVDLNPEIIDRLGLLAAVRCAGWKRPTQP